MRRYEVAHLTAGGDIVDFARIAPAQPAFEEAFSAFARGTLIQTEMGLVAVEDLLPGDRIKLASGDSLPLLWKGGMMAIPASQTGAGAGNRLVRIAADTFGFARPADDIVLGPAARLVHRTPAIRRATGRDGALLLASDFADGGSVVQIAPVASVEVFHLCLERHETILAGGLEVETYHPGANARFSFRGEYLNLFLSLFPHIGGLEDFGLTKYPRLALSDLDLMDIA